MYFFIFFYLGIFLQIRGKTLINLFPSINLSIWDYIPTWNSPGTPPEPPMEAPTVPSNLNPPPTHHTNSPNVPINTPKNLPKTRYTAFFAGIGAVTAFLFGHDATKTQELMEFSSQTVSQKMGNNCVDSLSHLDQGKKEMMNSMVERNKMTPLGRLYEDFTGGPYSTTTILNSLKNSEEKAFKANADQNYGLDNPISKDDKPLKKRND